MSFDLQVIRQQFPSLDRPAIFLDNPAGTQIAKHSLNRINKYLLENNANHEGQFETSRRSDETLHEAHAAMADFLNASRPEEIIFGNNMTTLFDAAIASPIAWMTTIARHAAIDMLRRGPERISAAASDVDPEVLDRLADPAADGARLTAGGQLSKCLGGLDEDRRSMIVLAYCHGWSREELSARFNRPVATVKTVLRRALISLKECLGDRD